ncbi:D-alanine--D-alanine ligase, partial [Candidatus Shapirobacteria bacterium]|nr:D-alanine--D-alanine ligase [Candidatus Shapirobacteria bacterium]
MKKLRVALLAGGWSEEREISIKTGQMIAKNLDKKKYQVFLFDPSRDLIRLVNALKRKKIDVVFPALHGPLGEDGTIQGLLEIFGMPYVFSGVLASALAMDKEMAKKIFKKEKIPIPKHFIFTKKNHISLKKVKFPCVVKPLTQGSSVGVTIVQKPSEFKKALKYAMGFGPKAMVEDFIEGREVTAAVLGNSKPRALPLIEIKPRVSHFFDYKAKYEVGGSEEICPAQINSVLTKKIQDLAIKTHIALGCRGVTRTD